MIYTLFFFGGSSGVPATILMSAAYLLNSAKTIFSDIDEITDMRKVQNLPLSHFLGIDNFQIVKA